MTATAIPPGFTHPDAAAGPVSIRQSFAWGELDALGHVNHTVFLRWFENVRIAWFERVGIGASSRDPLRRRVGLGPCSAAPARAPTPSLRSGPRSDSPDPLRRRVGLGPCSAAPARAPTPSLRSGSRSDSPDPGNQVGPILARIECDYRAPVEFPDAIWASAQCIELGRSSLILHNRIWSERHEAIVAEGRVVVVMLDYAAQRSVAIPEVVRAAILALDQPPERGAAT